MLLFVSFATDGDCEDLAKVFGRMDDAACLSMPVSTFWCGLVRPPDSARAGYVLGRHGGVPTALVACRLRHSWD